MTRNSHAGEITKARQILSLLPPLPGWNGGKWRRWRSHTHTVGLRVNEEVDVTVLVKGAADDVTTDNEGEVALDVDVEELPPPLVPTQEVAYT